MVIEPVQSGTIGRLSALPLVKSGERTVSLVWLTKTIEIGSNREKQEKKWTQHWNPYWRKKWF